MPRALMVTAVGLLVACAPEAALCQLSQPLPLVFTGTPALDEREQASPWVIQVSRRGGLSGSYDLIASADGTVRCFPERACRTTQLSAALVARLTQALRANEPAVFQRGARTLCSDCPSTLLRVWRRAPSGPPAVFLSYWDDLSPHGAVTSSELWSAMVGLLVR